MVTQPVELLKDIDAVNALFQEINKRRGRKHPSLGDAPCAMGPML
jgi:hypothetical protein